MYIVHVTSEFAPIAKVGGLGDMIQGLTKALKQEGEKVEVILPFYDHIAKDKLKNLKIAYEKLVSYENMGECLNTVWSAEVEGIQTYLIEPHHPNNYFKRGSIYNQKDDIERFVYFSRAALEFLLKSGKSPDILNLHDWIAGLCAPLYYEIYKSLGLKIKSVMTTLHNLCYQGVCKPEVLNQIGLHAEALLKADKLQDHHKPDRLNILKGALIYSDELTTVSPTYAEEIKGETGFGLGTLLTEHENKLHGILNGIDTTYWNPATDPYLKKKFISSPDYLEEMIEAKKVNRKHLSKLLNIEADKAPLFCAISRLVKQKGPELIQHGIEYVLKKGGQFVLLGTPLEADIKETFSSLYEDYRDNPHVHFHFEYDESLSHLLYGSADFIIIPSYFEPCGLTQMIAMRYATIPIVHKVGGLKDTVFDIDHDGIPLEKRNGYTFDFPSKDSLSWSIDRALEHFKHDEHKHKTILKNGLRHDWGWKHSALAYIRLYHEMIVRH